MNPINNAENNINYALTNKIKEIEEEQRYMKTNPQPHGNGSHEYAVFVVENLGPFTVPSGFMAQFPRIYAPDSFPFYYDGKEALHKSSFARIDWSIKVDVDDVDHVVPDGAAIAGQEGRVFKSAEVDYYGSSRGSNVGQMKVWYQFINFDSVSHNYWVTIQVLIPRPALKPI